jgi:predicted enzyme related to lactoylglutathione lyase
MLTRLNMLILMQSDLQKAIDFYQKLGGLTLKFHLKNQWAEFELGDLKLGLCPTGKEPKELRTGIVFEMDDVRAFYESHKDDLDFMGNVIEKVHGIMVSIKDPSGNIIDLYQPTPEKLEELIRKAKSENPESPEEEEEGGCGNCDCGGDEEEEEAAC